MIFRLVNGKTQYFGSQLLSAKVYMSCFVLKQHDMAYFTDDLPQFAHVIAQLFPGAEYF